MLGGNLGSLLYGDVSVMSSTDSMRSTDLECIMLIRICNFYSREYTLFTCIPIFVLNIRIE